MDYISRIPMPPLNVFIDDFYYIEGASPYLRLKVSPMPSLHLMINLGPAFQVYVPDQIAPFAICTDSWWIGLWDTYYIVDWPQPARFYGVHFKPAGVYPLLRLAMSELRNQVVPADAIWGKFAAEIRERLYAAPTVKAGLALLEKLLLTHFCETLYGLDMMQYAIGQITRNCGGLSIRRLSDKIGISENHLETQFKRMVGVTPKELARFYRFAHVVTSIDPVAPIVWTQIARKAHFYDLSHLNKDFLALTGHNPTEYLRLRQRFQKENPDHPLSVGPLPID